MCTHLSLKSAGRQSLSISYDFDLDQMPKESNQILSFSSRTSPFLPRPAEWEAPVFSLQITVTTYCRTCTSDQWTQDSRDRYKPTAHRSGPKIGAPPHAGRRRAWPIPSTHNRRRCQSGTSTKPDLNPTPLRWIAFRANHQINENFITCKTFDNVCH